MNFRTFLIAAGGSLALYLGGKQTATTIGKYLTQTINERIVEGAYVKPNRDNKKYVEVFVQDAIFPKGRFEARARSNSVELIVIPDVNHIPEARIQKTRLNYIRIDLIVSPNFDLSELVEAGAKVSPYDTSQKASDGIYDRKELLNKIRGSGAKQK